MRIFWVLLFSSSIVTAQPVGDVRLAPGDFKGGYDKLDYETDSLSLPARTGIDADLIGNIKSEHLGLPSFSAYQQEAPDASAIALGRKFSLIGVYLAIKRCLVRCATFRSRVLRAMSSSGR